MVIKNRVFVFVFAFIVFIGGVLMVVGQKDELDIKAFEVSEYQDYIEDFSSDENLGFFSDVNDLVKKVEAIWIKKYGESTKKQKPYKVFYDEENGVWLVQGTLRPNVMGGSANILVEEGTGKILAIWHDK